MYEQMHRLLIRGAELVVREYAPAAESRTVPAQRTVLLLHGVCEHGGRYGEFATAAVLRGWRVLVPDLRGHGISGGIRTHITDVQEYLADAESILQQLVRQDALLTVVGHSFGGLLAALWILQEPLRFRAGVMLSPAMGVNVPISLGKWVAGKLLSLVWPTFRFKTGIKGADLSHDEEYLARRRADTLIIRSVTCGWFFAMQRGVERAWEASARCQIPLLVLQGSADPVVNPAAAEKWCAEHGGRAATFRMLVDYRHELLQETHRVQTIRELLDWLDRVAPPGG